MLILSSPVEAERLIQENTIALLYFGSESCGVCRAVQPKLEALLAEYPGIAAAKVDTAHSMIQRGVQHLYHPWDSGFRQGQEVIREARHFSLGELEGKIRRLYSFLVEAPRRIDTRGRKDLGGLWLSSS